MQEMACQIEIVGQKLVRPSSELLEISSPLLNSKESLLPHQVGSQELQHLRSPALPLEAVLQLASCPFSVAGTRVGELTPVSNRSRTENRDSNQRIRPCRLMVESEAPKATEMYDAQYKIYASKCRVS